MNIDLLTLIPFSIITAFSPGPNNITCASMGLNFGYKPSFKYIMGIFTGTMVVMFLCAVLSSTIVLIFPMFKTVMTVLGALYITYLAYKTLKISYGFNLTNTQPLNYGRGVILQLINPKAVVYGLSVYSTFFKEVPIKSIFMPMTILYIGFVTFFAVSTWTLFGTVIKHIFKNDKLRISLNIVLALLLLYTAIKLLQY
ncbi:MAG: LysE family translocator [Spirochaetaceae bacterium]